MPKKRRANIDQSQIEKKVTVHDEESEWDLEDEENEGDQEDEENEGDQEDEESEWDLEDEESEGDMENEENEGDLEDEENEGDQEDEENEGDMEDEENEGDQEDEENEGDQEDEESEWDLEGEENEGDLEDEENESDLEDEEKIQKTQFRHYKKTQKTKESKFDPVIIKSFTSSRSKTGVASLINSAKNGKRFTLAGEMVNNLGKPLAVLIGLSDSEIKVTACSPNTANSLKLGRIGAKGVIYRGELVEKITERYDLDFTSRVSITFQDAEYQTEGNQKVAIIKVI